MNIIGKPMRSYDSKFQHLFKETAMMSFVQAVFNALIIQTGIIGIFPEPITLKSGRKSHWYVNWRDALSDAWTAFQVAEHLRAFLRDTGIEYDCIYGVPEGATKLGILATFLHAQAANVGFQLGSHPLPMGRGKPKDHGHPKDRFFVGAPKGKVVVVEDVTTTGGSLLDTLAALRELDGVEIAAAIGLTNRMEKRDDGDSVSKAVFKTGVTYHCMSSALALLPTVIEETEPASEIVDFIVQEFEAVGLAPLEIEKL